MNYLLPDKTYCGYTQVESWDNLETYLREGEEENSSPLKL